MPPVRIVWHAGSVAVLAEPQAVALPPVWRLLLLGAGSTTRSLSPPTDLLQSWGRAEKAPWQGPDQAAIPNRLATKVA